MANWLQRFKPKSAFARGVGVLVGGTAGAQLLMVLAAPLLTRLYSPEDFGLLAVYSGLLALCTVIAALRYELAIPLPESNSEAAKVLLLSLFAVVMTTGAVGFLLYIWGEQLVTKLDVPKLADHLWILPVGMFLVGVYQAFNYWAIRKKEFKEVARTKVYQALGTLIIQIFGFKFGGLALILGQAAGQSVGGFRLGRLAFRQFGLKDLNLKETLRLANVYRRFPVYSTWAALFNSAGNQLPPLMFAALFGGGVAGLYALAHRVLILPVSVVGASVGNVFFSNATDANRSGRLGELVGKVSETLSKLIMVPVSFLVIYGPETFSFAFGSQWNEAGVFARWLAPWICMVFITSPISYVFPILNKEHDVAIFQVSLLLVRVLSIGMGALYSDALLAIALFSLSSAFGYFCFLLRAAHLARLRLYEVIFSLIKSMSIALGCLLPIVLADFFELNEILFSFCLFASVSLVLLCYFSLAKNFYR